jgi:xylulokinase
LAAASRPGANGLVALPYFYGERTPINDPQARGLIAGLTLAHTRADVYRALLEAVGYSVRHNVEALREAVGASAAMPPVRCLAVGGGTRNRPWMQMVSDIAGIDQYIPDQSYGASYGDAFLAGMGAGFYRDIAQVAEWVRHKEIVRPDPVAHEQYEKYYPLYLQLYRQTAPSLHLLAGLADH